MSNDSINDFSVSFNAMLQTVGVLAQQLVELVNVSIKAVGQFIEPLLKTTSDLACTGTTAVTSVFQGSSSVSAPKK